MQEKVASGTETVAARSELRMLAAAMVRGVIGGNGNEYLGWMWVNGVLVLTLTADGQVAGKLIGRQGRMARAMRTVLGAAAVERGIRCELNIVSATRTAGVDVGEEGGDGGR